MRHTQNYCGVRTFFILAFFVPVFLFNSCKSKVPLANADINPAFENIPPIAENITLKILKEPTSAGNVLVSARFDTNVVKGRFHAVMVSDEKLVLRDDGKGGDEKESDGIFSIILKEDINQFRSDLSNIRKKIRQAATERKSFFKWVNRSPVSIDDKVKRFGSSDTDTATAIELDPDIVFLTLPDPVLNDRSLMITDLGVVEDGTRTFNPCTGAGTPNGAWTFGKLMTDMANSASTGITAENFVKEWLDKLLTPQVVNGETVALRLGIFGRIIKPWIIRSNPGIDPTTITQANWKTKTINLQFAPFKLQAIVNRLDLRGNSGYTISNAGEGRFVWGALDNECGQLQATVIFEYGIPKKTCASLKAFAQQWIDLKTKTPGTVAYNNALQAITDQFTAAGAGGTKPNGSALNQLRTNEIDFGLTWELREFNIDATSHLLFQAPVKQEPNGIFNRNALPASTVADQTILANYVNEKEDSIMDNTYVVPLMYSGVNFLGGKAHTETEGHFWDAVAFPGAGSITSDSARHFFSLNTCGGCHGGEGGTVAGNKLNDPPGINHRPFLHISPHSFGLKATLSAFITGDPANADGMFNKGDPAIRPAGSPIVWKFNDLARRNVDLQELADQACRGRIFDLVRALKFRPVHMTH